MLNTMVLTLVVAAGEIVLDGALVRNDQLMIVVILGCTVSSNLGDGGGHSAQQLSKKRWHANITNDSQMFASNSA